MCASDDAVKTDETPSHTRDALQHLTHRLRAQHLPDRLDGHDARPLANGEPSAGAPTLRHARLEARVHPTDPMLWLAMQPVYPRLFFANQSSTVVVGAVGAAHTLRTDGAPPDDAQWATMIGACAPHARMRYYGGTRFDAAAATAAEWADFGGSVFVLPQWELQLCGGACYLACNLCWRADASGDGRRAAAEAALRLAARLRAVSTTAEQPRPAHALPLPLAAVRAQSEAQWDAAVGSALDGIARRRWDKLVLAQRTTLQLSRPVEALHLLRCLVDSSGMRDAPSGGGAQLPGPPTRHAYLFLLQLDASTAFLGCSPEKLLRLDGAELSTDALAGTRRRGGTPEEDAALAADLLASEKDLCEVMTVRQFLVAALAPESAEVHADEPPRVVQLRHVQHIHIPITARLRAASTAAAVPRALALLHPTPAVCGMPQGVAREAIRGVEHFDRGFYAGPFGFVGGDGCEFCVAIRSALQRGTAVHLYAGAGIVPGSRASAEWDEVEAKMSPFTSLFPVGNNLLSRVLLRYQMLSRLLFVEDSMMLLRAAKHAVSPRRGAMCGDSRVSAEATPPPRRAAPGSYFSLRRSLALALRVSRPYFWLVTLWLYLLPAARNYSLWRRASFWAGLLYCVLPLNLVCYLMNDIADVAVDAHNPRKRGMLYGVIAHSTALRALVPFAAAAQLPFLAYFGLACGPLRVGAWFAAVLLVNWAYNFGPRLSSRHAPLDLLCPCGYMLVIPFSCALNGLPMPPARAWLHTLFFVVRSQLWIQTFDIDADARSGRRNTSVVLGLARAQLLLATILSAEVAFVVHNFDDPGLAVFSASSLALLGAQAWFGPLAHQRLSPMAIHFTFAVLGLGGVGLLCHVYTSGALLR